MADAATSSRRCHIGATCPLLATTVVAVIGIFSFLLETSSYTYVLGTLALGRPAVGFYDLGTLNVGRPARDGYEHGGDVGTSPHSGAPLILRLG